MPTQNVNLTDGQSEFIKSSIAAGRYKNASEVVRAGLRLLAQEEEQYRIKLERLRAEVQKGMDAVAAGQYVELNTDEDIDAFFDNVEAEVLEEWKSQIADAKTA